MRFRVMRIIDYRIVDVPGIGRIWIRYDLQTDRMWAGYLYDRFVCKWCGKPRPDNEAALCRCGGEFCLEIPPNHGRHVPWFRATGEPIRPAGCQSFKPAETVRRIQEVVERLTIGTPTNLRYGIDVPIAVPWCSTGRIVPMPDELPPLPPPADGRPPCGDCGTLCELDPRDNVWVCPACHRTHYDSPLPKPKTGVDGDGI